MKSVFNRIAHTLWPRTRFIDIEGRPWHKLATMDEFEGYQVYGALAAVGCIWAGAHFLPERGLLYTLAGNSFDYGAALYFAKIWQSPTYLASTNALKRYAIDRQGRAIPPQNMPDLLTHIVKRKDHCAKAFQKACLLASLGLVVPATSFATGSVGIPSATLVMIGPVVYKYGADYLRCKKLLDGKYRLCGTPPAEPKKQPKLAWLPTLAPKGG